MSNFHTSVLLKEVLDYLRVQKGSKYIDATLGGGGHTFTILERGGKVLGIDVDQDAIDYVKEKSQILNLKSQIGKGLILARGNFRKIEEIAHLNGFDKVSGILFDLGVSSHQLEIAERGFSFQKEGPLDMRMDRDLGVKASDLLKILTKGELYELFARLGEETQAFPISRAIDRSRRVKPIETTTELAQIIARAHKGKFAKINPSTRVFQALRIAVNDELKALEEGLIKSYDLLDKNGRILVISFHSLEDRMIKNIFNQFEEEGKGKVITKKPIVPAIEEIEVNKRSRSAKLRVFQRII